MSKKPAVNKSQSVRDFLKDHPKATNKEVVEALSKQGIKLSTNHVANIRSKRALSKGKRTRRGKAASAMSAKTGVDIFEIKAAFLLLKQCGSHEGAKKALAAALEIQKII
jgi:hypothetical protein